MEISLIPHASATVRWGVLALAVWVAGLFTWAVLREARTDQAGRRLGARALAIAGLWLAAVSAAALTGWLARFELRPPPYLLLMVAMVGLSIWAGASQLGKRLAEHVPLFALVGAQAFRLPLELVMHRGYEEGVVPIQLSYSGFNVDIITGTGALILGVLLYFKRASIGLVAAWNALGFACLLVIAVVAILTSPILRVFGEGSGNVNYWVAYFPYVLVPAACVVFAVAGHIVILRKLRLELDARQTTGTPKPKRSAGKRGAINGDA